MSAPAPNSDPSGPLPRDRRGTALWTALGVLAAVVLTVWTVLAAGEHAYLVLGYPAPGLVTTLGVSLLRLVLDLSAAVCVGSLVFCAFFTTPRRDRMVSPDGYAAVRAAETSAWVWAGAGLLLTVFDAADSSGQPVSEILAPTSLLELLGALDAPDGWLLSAAVAVVLALSCHFVLRWRTTIALSLVGALGVLPPVLVGHGASNAGHDFASDSLGFHVVAATLWLGTLFAVLAHALRGGAHQQRVALRYQRLAAGCWVVLAASGVVSSLVLVPPDRLLETRYGALVLAKVGMLVLIAAVSVPLRRRAFRAGTGTRRAVLRLAGLEGALLLGTLGISMGMAHVPPPNLLARDTSASELLIGYDLPAFPDPTQLLTAWRFDLLLGTAAVLLAVGYALGVRRLRAAGTSWPVGRTASWMAGCATVLVASSSGLGSYAPATFGVHMTAHLLLNMVGPALLVLGHPVLLALNALPGAERGGLFGPREWVLAVVHSPVARAVTHPVVASVLLAGSLYGLYLTGLFQWVMQEHWAHTIMNVYFLVTGYLWFWSVLGTDRTPRRVPQLARLGVTLGMMPLLAFFGVLVLSMDEPIADNYYRTLDLAWSVDPMAAQRAGALIGWLGGELPMLLVLVVLLSQWQREQGDDDAEHEGLFERLESTRS
ncbi:cytochrome c oxidase assembly protein [Actinopolyspora mortivallis]|uniref:Copper resistance protein CopD n=1 Tax=Actinopolyspora mortivallis TaxID=33906 RepID=A0A2T0GX92_ACTMO|nr:cytochrome c oxidase assembly protein [Actinopolyspora mortivallis]PRW63720.1 copper resistance protein CopD [Actinopolyspora mortivallis]